MQVNNVDNGIEIVLDQHDEYEREWIESPVPQWTHKEWTVIEEQTTLDEVMECIANSIDFIDFTDAFQWGSNYFEFVALIKGEPHVFHIEREDVSMLNVSGERTITYEPDEFVQDTIDEIMDEFFKED